jgi:Tol biopolymer transport system component
LFINIQLIPENRAQLYLVSFPGGEKRRITNDLSDYAPVLDLTHDGKMLVGIETRLTSHIFVLPGGQTAQAKQITSGETADTGVEAGPSGKLLVHSRSSDVVLMNADGSDRVIPQPNLRDYGSLSACGDRYLALNSYEDNKGKLIRTDADGSNPVKLTDDSINSACSPDGTWVLSAPSAGQKLQRIPIEGGAPTVIATFPMGVEGTISPDGKWIACSYQEPGQGPVPARKLSVISVDGGAPTHVFTRPAKADHVRWSPDQKGLQFLWTRDGATNVWEQPLNGDKPHPITNFTSGRIFGFAWSRDGKQLYIAKGENVSDVVLISNFTN